MDIKAADIAPPNYWPYNEWYVEIHCDILFEEDWDESIFDSFETEQYLTPPPGWEITGWEYYAHKDARFILSVYFNPPPATLELRNQAAAIGRDLLPWIDRLDEWLGDLRSDDALSLIHI